MMVLRIAGHKISENSIENKSYTDNNFVPGLSTKE